MEQRRPLRVAHLVDALDATGQLWGKERVIAQLMREQRSSGLVEPRLITFAPGQLGSVMSREGFTTVALDNRRGLRGTDRAIRLLARELAKSPVDVVHSHGYKSNLVIRALRALGKAPKIRIVSTCHGWDFIDAKLWMYNAFDRWSVGLSDMTTVPDSRMLLAMPPRARAVHVPNGVPDRTTPSGDRPPFLREGDRTFVIGTMCRLNTWKGIPEVLEAARQCADPSITFAIAGAGDLAPQVEAAGGNVLAVGYLSNADEYVAAIDVYLQASHTEGLSLSLLEAMRAGKAIVATDVGATRDAISDESAIIIPPRDPQAILDAVARLKSDPLLRAKLGRAARKRFEAEFRADRPHRRFLELYEMGRSA
jgi:glycosyltransferase involved in cell wall biosynthesis